MERREEKSRPIRHKPLEARDIIEDPFSQEYLENSGSISNSQAKEGEIGLGDFMSNDPIMEQQDEEMERV